MYKPQKLKSKILEKNVKTVIINLIKPRLPRLKQINKTVSNYAGTVLGGLYTLNVKHCELPLSYFSK